MSKSSFLVKISLFTIPLFFSFIPSEQVFAATLLDFNEPGASGTNWPGWNYINSSDTTPSPGSGTGADSYGSPGWIKQDAAYYFSGQWQPKIFAKNDYTIDGNPQNLAAIDTTDKAPGTSSGSSLKVYSGPSDTTYHSSWWYMWQSNWGKIGLADSTTNRLSFYTKFQMNGPTIFGDDQGTSHVLSDNVHFGTYCALNTADYSSGGNGESNGWHFYHYLVVNPGTWLHIELDRHPSHIRGGSGSGEPDDNPTSATGNYFSLLNHLYYEIRYKQSAPTAYWLDELKTRTTSEAENDISISSAWVGYWNSLNYWEIGFSDNSFNSTGYNASSKSTFEIRYSTSPITNANYSSATPITPQYQAVSGAGRIKRLESWVKPVWTRFQLPAGTETSNNIIYFAIKDVSSTANGDGHNAPSPLIHTIDYNIRPTSSTPDTTPPTLPSNFNLAASATSQSSITVSWNPATDDIGVTSYQVERCTGLSCTTFAQVGTPTASPFVDSGLTPSTGYSYHVRALDAAGNMSSWSNVVGATTQAPDTTPPTAPTSLTAIASSSSQVNLTWTASTDNVGVTGYKVERCQGSSCTNFSEITNQPTTNYQDTSLSPSTTYRYQVRAVDGAGNNSAYSSIAQATTQVAPPVSVNMMAAYNFNENTGTTINDLSGHTNTGTASNATWTTSGKNGSALSFNGSSSSVSVSDNNTLDITGSFTLSAWIYSSNLSGYRDVVLKGNNANNYYLETNGTNISFGFYQSGVWHEHNSTSANLQTNTWTHIAGVFDTDANTVTLYKNGVQIYQASETGTPPANTLPLTIGSGFSGENYGGSIDDVRIYNKALTQTEIQTDMNTPLTQPTSTVSCNTVTTTNFSQAAYNSYGAPFDAFQTGTNLLDAKCNSADAHTINLTTGVTGDTTRIVYTKGYYYDPVTAGWTQYSGTCNGALNGEWCQGSVSATITSPNLSTASASNPAYLVGMTCSVQGGGWKCGCRDTSCANFYWQVQGAGM